MQLDLRNTDGYKSIRAIEIDPQNPEYVYAGITGKKAGVFVSKDRGKSWALLNPQLSFSNIHELAVDPNDSNRVYACPWGGGLFKSQDAGSTWDEIRTPTLSIVALSIDPANSAHILIADRTSPQITVNHRSYFSEKQGFSCSGKPLF